MEDLRYFELINFLKKTVLFTTELLIALVQLESSNDAEIYLLCCCFLAICCNLALMIWGYWELESIHCIKLGYRCVFSQV